MQKKDNRIKMNDTVGIIKEIDRLGRIVISGEFRDRFGLVDNVEVIEKRGHQRLVKLPIMLSLFLL